MSNDGEILDVPTVFNKQPNRPKGKCPKCGSNKVGIFPNCSYTYGCIDCGKAFVKKTKEQERESRHGKFV